MADRAYHLWNPFTTMDEFLKVRDFGPITIVRGEGPYVFNSRGAKFINGFSSLWNVAIGHGREELVEAAARQMRELAYASCFRQVHPRAMELAAKLVEITEGRYQRVYLGTNGSEAVETALKMARQYHRQGRREVDMLRGTEDYKYRFNAVDRQHVHFRATNRGMLRSAACRLREAELS